MGPRVASPSWFLIYLGGADICQPGNTASWPDGPPGGATLGDSYSVAQQVDSKKCMGTLECPYQSLCPLMPVYL